MAAETGRTYPFAEIEARWRKRWLDGEVFRAEPRSDKPKFYCFEYPPYPNGKLHIGHVRSYSIGDATARFRRMRGYNVLYTQGFDAFGLPNDLAAREQGCHPAEWTERCIAAIKSQFDRLGLSYDRRRLVGYHQEDYYRWTQWLFLKLLDAGLAYRGTARVNWCDHCKTTLADDQLETGRCWRCKHLTEDRRMTQWFMRTTHFCEPMLANLEGMDAWSERIRKLQRNWIGRSVGIDARFEIDGLPGLPITVFTKHPEILYGMCFVGIAMDHPALDTLRRHQLLEPRELEAIEELRSRTQEARGRIRRGKNKKGIRYDDGVLLKLKVRHPMTSELLPLVVANYIEADFATGAAGGVPAHDRRDRVLARKLGIPGRRVLAPPGEGEVKGETAFVFDDSWVLMSSGPFDGMSLTEVRAKLPEELARRGVGGAATYYHLRDWLVSRQRYWGTPIPVVYCQACGMVPVPEDDLPVRLPADVDLTVVGNPLEYHPGFVTAACPRCGRVARRETDTLDAFVGAIWFYYRYAVGAKSVHPFLDEEARYWMPGDIAIGGIEHATTAYFHDRFLTHAFHHLGLIDHDEPAEALVAHQLVIRDGRKMSKSLGNAIDPDDLMREYGADSLRLAILFMASPDKKLEWSETTIRACHHFLVGLWELTCEQVQQVAGSKAASPWQAPALSEVERLPLAGRKFLFAIHQITADVVQAYESYLFNVVIQRLMRLKRLILKYLQQDSEDRSGLVREALSRLVRMLAPIAPHLSEELWEVLGGEGLVLHAPWPETDRTLLAARHRKVIVQLDGDHRGDVEVPPGSDSEQVRRKALDHLRSQEPELDPAKIQDWLYIRRKRFDVVNFLTSSRARRPPQVAEERALPSR